MEFSKNMLEKVQNIEKCDSDEDDRRALAKHLAISIYTKFRPEATELPGVRDLFCAADAVPGQNGRSRANLLSKGP